MRHLSFLAVVLLVAAACGAGPGPRTPAPSQIASSAGPAAPTATAIPTAARTPAPTEAPATAEPPDPDPERFLQTCGVDPPRPGSPIPCQDAVVAGLSALGAAEPARVDVRFDCGDAPGCSAPDIDRAFVTIGAGDDTTEVEVRRTSDGAIAPVSTRPGTLPPPPAFSPPPARRADIPDPPPGLAARPVFPLCGQEDTPMGGPYDEAARTCFRTGVLAGSPVEFASIGAGTEGLAYVVLYRYAGSGGVEVVTGEGGQWSRTFTGIRDAPGGLVFDVAGMSTAPEPVP